MRESFKSKGNCLVSVLAANVLNTAFQVNFLNQVACLPVIKQSDCVQEHVHWPDQFLKVYIDDAMGERLWVDHPECRQFTDNILTAFSTILHPSIR